MTARATLIKRTRTTPVHSQGDGPSCGRYRTRVEASLFTRQMGHVLERSRFYQRKLGCRAGRPITLDDLPSLPFTTREELQADQDEHGPFGSYLCTDRSRIARVHRTSGTSGRPLIIALSAADIEDSLICGARCFSAAGVRTDDVIVHCLGYCMWSGGVTDHEALERAGAAVVPFGVGNSSELIRMIQTIRPTGIHCTPSYLSRLEQRMESEFDLGPRDLGLRIGLFGGEPGIQEAPFREHIERTWGLRAVDANYGISEALSMLGAECDARSGLHFMGGDVVLPEIKEADCDRVAPWEPGAAGELVLTHLRRECQPLIRYRTSDLIEVVGMGACECGRSTPRFRVVRRVDDMVVIRGVNVFVRAIGEVVRRVLDDPTAEYRVLVDRSPPLTQCIVRAESSADAAADAAAEASKRLAHALADALHAAIKVRASVELVAPGGLPRTDGKTQRLERTL